MIDLKKSSVRWDRENYVPRKIYGFDTKPQKGTPRQIAERFLRENSGVLKIGNLRKEFTYDKTAESLATYTVLYQQHFEGTPIHGAWLAVHIDQKGRVFMVKNDTVPVFKLEKKIKTKKAAFLSAVKIVEIAKKKAREYGELDTGITKEKMIYALKGNFRNAWKVKFGTLNPAASWILFIDAVTGHVFDERNVLRKIDGKGLVFRPNPVVTLDRDDLLDQKDKDSEVFRKAYKMVTLKDLQPGGTLTGPYVDTTKTLRYARSSDSTFLFEREDDCFEEVMAYYHIDALQRYIQTLGFSGGKGILNRVIRVNVHGIPDDQSFYDPSPGRHDLTFGDGGVDDAEDAEVILHEYGHAIQDAVITGFGQTNEGRAMGEGFGDYIGASFFARYKTKPRKVKVAEWDAKGYAGGPQECLRRLDSPKRYPEHMEGEEHADGEIWSACLWKVRAVLGAKKADTVVLESHFYLNQYSDFKDGAEAIIMAEKNLYGGKRTKALTKTFRECGILQ